MVHLPSSIRGVWIDLARSLLAQFDMREAELVEPGVLDGLRGSLEVIEGARGAVCDPFRIG